MLQLSICLGCVFFFSLVLKLCLGLGTETASVRVRKASRFLAELAVLFRHKNRCKSLQLSLKNSQCWRHKNGWKCWLRTLKSWWLGRSVKEWPYEDESVELGRNILIGFDQEHAVVAACQSLIYRLFSSNLNHNLVNEHHVVLKETRN